MPAWEHWYHCTSHTYGRWLRGDPRGWRTRHHREHVEGDYKSPPAEGSGEALFAYSKHLMKRDPVAIADVDLREFVLLAVVERMIERGVEVRVGCFDGVHLHTLIRCLKDDPKIVVGIGKQFATTQLKAHGLAVGMDLKLGEGIWAKGSGCKPIRDDRHFWNAAKYIRDHFERGAVVWEVDGAARDLK